MTIPAMVWHRPRPLLALTVLLAAAMAAMPAQAHRFKVLHTFHGPNGAAPRASLIRDGAGNLYGTTSEGGNGVCSSYGCGTAFKLDKTGKQVWLHSFSGKDGMTPAAGLLRGVSGTLYGTTTFGGKIEKVCGGPPAGGCGTVFKLDDTGKQTVLHKFAGDPDGFFPEALLVSDKTRNLYGTTSVGGSSGFGSVFMIDAADRETVLYSFTCGSDGCAPYPGVVLDSADNLYGAAFYGGAGWGNNGYGVVFKVDTSGNETVLHTFNGGLDGANPSSVLTFDAQGNIYGTTQNGGSAECGGTGCGTVFELSPGSGGTWTETVLYAFCSLSGCADGESPGSGPLVRDSPGNLYGTTRSGGTYNNGVIFKVDINGSETVLYNFTGGADGGGPEAGLASDKAGNLYGTAGIGGDLNCAIEKEYGCGVVFKLIP